MLGPFPAETLLARWNTKTVIFVREFRRRRDCEIKKNARDTGDIKIEGTPSVKWLVKEGKNRFQFSILTFQLFFFRANRKKTPLGDLFLWRIPFSFFCYAGSYLVARVVELSVIVCFVTWKNKQTSGGYSTLLQPWSASQMRSYIDSWSHSSCMLRNSCLALLNGILDINRKFFQVVWHCVIYSTILSLKCTPISAAFSRFNNIPCYIPTLI